MNTVSQIGLDFWMVVTWRVFAVLGALLGSFLLGPFERWSVHLGYLAWSTLPLSEADFASAPWRKICWWILLSFAALIGGWVYPGAPPVSRLIDSQQPEAWQSPGFRVVKTN